MPSINSPFFVYWTFSYCSHSLPDEMKPQFQIQIQFTSCKSLKEILTINHTSGKKGKKINLLPLAFLWILKILNGWWVGCGQWSAMSPAHTCFLCSLLRRAVVVCIWFPNHIFIHFCLHPTTKKNNIHAAHSFPNSRAALPLLLRTAHLLESTSSHSLAR